MLDINFIRENIDVVRAAIKNKRSDVDLDNLLEIDNKRRDLITKVEEIRQQRNEINKSLSSAPSPEIIEKGKELKLKLDELEPQLEEVTNEFNALMIFVPNIPASDVPIGASEDENQVVRKWGEPTSFDFEPKDHLELGQKLGIIETEKAAKVSGARFAYLLGEAVFLQFALIQHTFKLLQNETILKELANKIDPAINYKKFIPVIVPDMIKPDVYTKMGRLDPVQAEERYHLAKDDMYLIGSAEHTLGPIHMDEIIPEDQFPIRYVGYSTSFRREAGSYGKDTKGLIRMHQFDKIEMETFSLPELSTKEQDFIVAIQEHLVQSLNIPYQVIAVCTGDMGGPDARQFDIECWMPGQQKYRETHTSDLMTDYQSRRLNTRVRRKDGTVEYVHMNDATAFAIGRILVAIIENYQQEDGSIKVPEALVPYTGFDVIAVKN